MSNFSNVQTRFRDPNKVEALIKEQLVAAKKRTTQVEMGKHVGMEDPKLLIQRLRGSAGEKSWFEERLAKLGIDFRQWKDWIVTEDDSDWQEYNSSSEERGTVSPSPSHVEDDDSKPDYSVPMPSAAMNIPDMLHGCLGREEAAADVIEALCKDRPKPVLLYGGPGIGKTTLKKYVLLNPKMEKRFGERRYWVESDKAYNADVLVRLIADSLGLGALDPNPDTARTVLLAFLRNLAAPVAIGLDNIETPLGIAVPLDNTPESDKEKQRKEKEAKELLKALGEIPHVALLASLRGEVSVAAGNFWEDVEVEALARDPAVILFLSVNKKLNPKPSEEQVAALIKQVDYVPLAVVLLASYAKRAGNFAQLEREWKARSVALLEHGTGKADSWQSALHFSLENPILKRHSLASRLVRLMGQLPDGIHPIDAEQILEVEEAEISEARNLLLDLGLIRHETRNSSGHWTMLHPVREFLRTEATYAPDTADWARSTEKYLRLLDLHGPKLGKERAAIEALYPEIDNVGAALLKQLRDDESNRKLLGRFWYYGYFIFWVIEKGNQWVLEEGAKQNTQSFWWSLGKLEANCIKRLGDINQRNSEFDLAQSRYKQAMPLYKAAEDKIGEANCIKGLGDIHLRNSEFDLAQSHYEQAMLLFQAADEKIGEANCIRKLGDIHLRNSEFDLAQLRYEQAMLLYQAIGETIGEANCIYCLGNIHLSMSEFNLAQSRYEQAMSLYLAAGEKTGEANCIKSLGDIHLSKSEFDLAQSRYEQAMSLYQSVGENIGEANCIKRLNDIRRRSQRDLT